MADTQRINRNRIKIMHVAQSAGGVNRYLQSLFKYMDKEKFENILVCSFEYEQEEFDSLVDNCIRIDMRREIGGQDVLAVVMIRNLIKRYSPDIVYAHSSKAGALVRIANFGMKSKCLYNPHGWAFNIVGLKKRTSMYAIIEKLAAPFCDKIICISEAEKCSAIEKKICHPSKLKVIFNGIDIDENEEENNISRQSLLIPENAYVLGCVGRLSLQKSPDVFIKAAKIILERIPSSYFVFVGDGDMRNEIEKYAQNNGFQDRILITGWVNNPIEYIKIFDIALLLSRWEGFGLVLPEYMLVGKPIVATKVDAIPNIIEDHVNGILVQGENPVAVSDAVFEIYSDEELKNRIVKNGKKDVLEKYDARRVSKEHELIFEKICDEK